MSDDDSDIYPAHSTRSPSGESRVDPMAEVLRLVRSLSAKVDTQTKEINDIKLRLERGASSIEGAEKQGQVLQEVRDKQIVLDTRFNIVWAGLAVAGTASITGLVAGLIALLKSAPS